MSRIIPILALGLALCATAAAERQVADLAARVCSKPDKNLDDLTSVSAMLQLIDYFEDKLPAKDACRGRYLSSLRFLQVVLTVGNDNVCSDEKVSLLEDFNRRYISTTHRDKHNQKDGDLEAPESVKVFFMHYAYQVSSVCKESLSAAYEKVQLQFLDQDGKPADMDKVDGMLQGFQDNFGMNAAKNGYKDLILPWKLMDAFHVSDSGKKLLSDVVIDDGVSKTRIPVRISIRVNGADKFRIVQKACAEHLKPKYSRLALPILRLINLGLYENSEPFAQQLASNKDIGRLFGVAQICETLLPVEAFQDDSLDEGKVVAMTAEKAAELRVSQPSVQSTAPVQSESGDSGVALGDLDDIESLADPREAQRLTAAIRSNRNEQESVVRRIIKLGSSIIKTNVKTKAGQLMSLVNPIDKTMVTNLELESTTEGLERKKRSVLVIAAAVVLILAFLPVILQFTMFVLKFALGLSLMAILFPFYLVELAFGESEYI